MGRNALYRMNRHIMIEELLPCLDDMDTEIMLMSGIGALDNDESRALSAYLSEIRRFAEEISSPVGEGSVTEETRLRELDNMVKALREDIDTAMLRRSA